MKQIFAFKFSTYILAGFLWMIVLPSNHFAFAQQSCAATLKAIDGFKLAVQKKLTFSDMLEPETIVGIKDLAQNLYNSNSEFLGGQNAEHVKLAWNKKTKRPRILPHDHFWEFTFEVATNLPDQNGNTIRQFKIRSNGLVAFISDSYRIHQEKGKIERDFRVVYRGFSNEILIGDQSKLILETISSQFLTLSRTMHPAEAEAWVNGHTDKILTKFPHGGIHFALNRYIFMNRYNSEREPLPTYITKIPKSVLLELLAKGEVRINTYSSDIHDREWGMPKTARTPFGLEIEIVILGNSARIKISPFMKDIERFFQN